MYTIYMNDDKELITSVKTKLFQREKLVDKIQFLFPLKYEDIYLEDCTATLKYLDQGNVAHSEILELDDDYYILSPPNNNPPKPYHRHRCSDHRPEPDIEDIARLRYVLPVDTDLTKFAGDVTIRITFTMSDPETESEYVLHTGEAVITISPLSDYYAFIDDDSLEVIDQKILELTAKLEAMEAISTEYDESKADDLTIEENRISLMANGKKIGTEWDIVTPQYNDGDVDGTYDGIVELGSIKTTKNQEV